MRGLVRNKKVVFALLTVVLTTGTSLTVMQSASASGVVWSQWKTCSVSGSEDYDVRTGWVRNTNNTHAFYDATQWRRKASIGGKPNSVVSVMGSERVAGKRIASSFEDGFRATMAGTVYFPGSMQWVSIKSKPAAVTALYAKEHPSWKHYTPYLCTVTTSPF
jgi:hypothetical protein